MSFRLLIGGAPSKFFHSKEFGDALSRYDVECKLVRFAETYSHVLNSRYWYTESVLNYFGLVSAPRNFTRILDEFQPHAILGDSPQYFSYMASRSNKPFFLHLRGDYWTEREWSEKTRASKLPSRRIAAWWMKGRANRALKDSTAILPICKYLGNVVHNHYPNKLIEVMYQGIRSDLWYPVSGMKLEHPCVGLLQDANIWGKTIEMLTLVKVMKAMPDVHFYWVGDGAYKDYVLPQLSTCPNFKWLGKLSYPDGVREFLSAIDVYALVSGMDMSPLTLLEAALMEKPVVATNVGGIPELMDEGKTGILVEKGNSTTLAEKLTLILNDAKLTRRMGSSGNAFVKENFNWDRIAHGFASFVKNNSELAQVKVSI